MREIEIFKAILWNTRDIYIKTNEYCHL